MRSHVSVDADGAESMVVVRERDNCSLDAAWCSHNVIPLLRSDSRHEHPPAAIKIKMSVVATENRTMVSFML